MLPLMRRRTAQSPPRPPDWSRAFGRRLALEVDLGCGRGHYALERARAAPGSGVVAIDTRDKWIHDIRHRARVEQLTNLRALRCDAKVDLPLLFGPATVSGFTVLHPDPWWKKRHRKRRLIQPELVSLLAAMLVPGGWIFVQSDVPDLTLQMACAFEAEPALAGMDPERLLHERLGGLQSHRARRCAALGIPIQRLAYRRP